MTHNYVNERTVLEELPAVADLLGELDGATRAVSGHPEDLVAEEEIFSDDERERLYMPIGLDPGGETPIPDSDNNHRGILRWQI